MKKRPLSTSKSIFKSAGLGEFGRTTRCKALKWYHVLQEQSKDLISQLDIVNNACHGPGDT